jgi:hypothetical protein
MHPTSKVITIAAKKNTANPVFWLQPAGIRIRFGPRLKFVVPPYKSCGSAPSGRKKYICRHPASRNTLIKGVIYCLAGIYPSAIL